MVSQADNVVTDFPTDSFFKLLCEQICRAGEHKVLPYYDTILVAVVIEILVRIITAAPHSYKVIVCGLAICKELSCFLFVAACDNLIFGDIVRTHCEYLHAVVYKAELLSPPVFFTADGERSKTYPLSVFICGTALFVIQGDNALIEGLFAVAVHPPKLRVVYHKLCFIIFCTFL